MYGVTTGQGWILSPAILRCRQITAIILPRRERARRRPTHGFNCPGEEYLSRRYIILFPPNVTVTRNCCVNLTHPSPDRVLRSLAPTANSTDTQLRNCPRISSTSPFSPRRGPSTSRLNYVVYIRAKRHCFSNLTAAQITTRRFCFSLSSMHIVVDAFAENE